MPDGSAFCQLRPTPDRSSTVQWGATDTGAIGETRRSVFSDEAVDHSETASWERPVKDSRPKIRRNSNRRHGHVSPSIDNETPWIAIRQRQAGDADDSRCSN